MDVFIALYRGINVGGKNPVKMASLRAMHERLGYQNVKSYIQSGNIVFSGRGPPDAIARRLAKSFLEEFGFAAKVMVVDATRWAEIVADNHYATVAAQNPAVVHVAICNGKPSGQGLAALLARVGKLENFVVGNETVYLHSPAGLGTSKFAAGMEKASGVPMTIRNWRTIDALWQMANAASESA